jgi:hypothetical protein
LRESGFLRLPSERLLQYKKNKVKQQPGIHKDMLDWMEQVAREKKTCDRGMHGFIVFDEMKIQVCIIKKH